MFQMTAAQYLVKYPNVARHMVNIPNDQPWHLDSGFLSVTKDFGWPSFEGSYIHWTLIDVRKYSHKGWESYHHTPFRLYFCDYDDWNAEIMFETEEEAEQMIVDLGKLTPLSLSIVYDLGIKPS